jgi:hypothetical protein
MADLKRLVIGSTRMREPYRYLLIISSKNALPAQEMYQCENHFTELQPAKWL